MSPLNVSIKDLNSIEKLGTLKFENDVEKFG